MKALIVFFLASITSMVAFASGGEITGQVKDSLTNETIVGANVMLMNGDKIVQGTVTDVDGYYTIKGLTPGEYTLKISFVAHNTAIYQHIKVYSDQPTNLSVALGNTMLEEFIIVDQSKNGKISLGFETGNDRVSSTELEHSALRPEQYMGVAAGAYQADYDQPITFRGSRVGTTLYIVDGMRIIGEPSLPLNSIEEEMVFMGGIPAKYGDTVGGVIVINTKSYHPY